jgi:type I restriction enzyme S subunit
MNGLEPVSFANAPFEIIDGDRGKNYPKREEFGASGYCLFLSATNVTKSGFNFSDCQFIDEKRDAALNKGKLRREDVVLTTRGTLGNTAYFNDSVPFNHLRINSGMVILRCDRTKLLPAFLYHFVRSPSFHSQVNGLRSGVAQPQLPIQDMRKIRLPVPSLPVQQRIAGILSAYDELIENSQRRIKILEAMARGLYREWFVHFRFPGHENHPRVASALGEIPQRWDVRKLGDLVEFKKGKKPASVLESEEVGLQRHLLIDALRGGSSREFVVPDKLISTTPDDTIMVMDGSGSSDVFIGHEGVIGSTLGRYRTQGDVDIGPFWIFLFFSSHLAEIKSKNVGSAIPHANKDFINGMDVVIGPEDVMQAFEKAVKPMFDLIQSLNKKANTLRATRDLLLPRLLSGQIDVNQMEPI